MTSWSSSSNRRCSELTIIQRRDVTYEEENDRSLIGKGSYGKVYRGRYRQQDVAVKNLHRIFFELAGEEGQEGVIAELVKECELLSELRHDNIVRLHGVVNAGSPRMCMVTELMDGSLDRRYPASPPLTRCDELDIALSISKALLYLHNYRPHPIIHRDLAPKNILFKEDGERLLVKLADVGLAKIMQTTRVTSRAAGSMCPGTQCYMPPEALATRGRPCYGPSLDVFSRGVSMVEMIICNKPSVLQTQRAADLEDVRQRDHPLHGVLHQCLSDDSAKRPTAAELVVVFTGFRMQGWYGKISSKQQSAHIRCKESSEERPWRNEYYKMMEARVVHLEVEVQRLNAKLAQEAEMLKAQRERTAQLEKQLHEANTYRSKPTENIQSQITDSKSCKQKDERRAFSIASGASTKVVADKKRLSTSCEIQPPTDALAKMNVIVENAPQAHTRGTISPATNFNKKEDAKALNKALGLRCDEVMIIFIVAHRSNQQRQEVRQMFRAMFDKDLMEELEFNLSGHLCDAVLSAMMLPEEYNACQLYKALILKEFVSTDLNSVLVETLWSRSNAEIKTIKDLFKRRYSKDLGEEIKLQTSGHFGRLVAIVLEANRDESQTTNLAKARDDARGLYKAREAKWTTDKVTLNFIFTSRSLPQLRATFFEYRQIFKCEITESFEKEMSGDPDLKNGLLAMVKLVRDAPGFFAERLHKAMKGFITNNIVLIHCIVTRSEVDMVEVKQSFQQMYKESVKQFIERGTSGNYCSCLLSMIGDGPT